MLSLLKKQEKILEKHSFGSVTDKEGYEKVWEARRLG